MHDFVDAGGVARWQMHTVLILFLFVAISSRALHLDEMAMATRSRQQQASAAVPAASTGAPVHVDDINRSARLRLDWVKRVCGAQVDRGPYFARGRSGDGSARAPAGGVVSARALVLFSFILFVASRLWSRASSTPGLSRASWWRR